MPRIKPFPGIHPAPQVAAKVAVQLEDLSLEGARSLRKQNPWSYINMLVPKVENPYLRGSKSELAYKAINDNFEEFLEHGILVTDREPAVYVYEQASNGQLFRGIWTITSIDDYLDNTIRKHEHTREEREQNLVEYIRQTGIDANPVLITYPGSPVADRMIQQAIATVPVLDFALDDVRHRLWAVTDRESVDALVADFAQLGTTYIADGHHRAAAACTYGIQRRKLNLKHHGREEYNYFSSVYMSFDQLEIHAFHRLVMAIDLDVEAFLTALRVSFQVTRLTEGEAFVPDEAGVFGLYLASAWYRLEAAAEQINDPDPVNSLDVSILQRLVLGPLLGIADPRADERLHVMGGRTPVSELVAAVDKGTFSLAFTLFPTTIGQLVRVADSGEVMPPKSTWFEPKFSSGLLIHRMTF